MKLVAHAALIVTFAACGGDVPAKPTWFSDVQPIVRSNCARCHGADPIEPAVAGYRLDRYVGNDPAFDAADYVDSIVRHAVEHEAPVMPPDYALTERQQEILVRWAALAVAERKGTRERNRPGRIELVGAPPADVDQEIEITYRAWDDDLDGLVVQLVARDLATGVSWNVGTPSGAGLRTLQADTGTLPSKHTFELLAIVDDGYSDDPAINQQNVQSLLGELRVDHGARGTAPTVHLDMPNGGDTLVGAETITWTAADPDVDAGGNPDALTIDLDLVPYAGGTAGTPIPIAANLANTGSFMWTIPASVPARDAANVPIPYRVRVTATDTLGVPQNSRFDESDLTFTIEESIVTTFTWDSVKSVFVQKCATSRCHDRDGVPKVPDYCAAQYDQGDNTTLCDATDRGVFEYRSLVLGEISTGAMPPGGQPQLTTMERDMLLNWLRGGAPEGASSGNPSPTFTWMQPSQSQTTGTTVDLAWSASDDTGIVSGVIEYKRLTGGIAVGCNNAGTTGWMTVTDPMATFSGGSTTWTGSLTWPLPIANMGYYCFRGRVKDAINAEVVRINPNGVAPP